MENNETLLYSKYAAYAEHVALAGFFATAVFGCTLIYLTIFGVTRNFGSYKKLLVTFAFFGIFFASCEVVLTLNVYSHNAGWIFYTASRPFNLSQASMSWLLSFYTGSYSLTTSMLSIQFVYRYWAIFDEAKLHIFESRRYFICLFLVSLFAVQWAIGMHYFLEFDDYSMSYFKTEMLQKFSLNISEIAGVALVAYASDGSLRWWNISCNVNMTWIMGIQYTIIIYCAYQMQLKMEAKLQMLSTSMRTLHKQFYKTLILQIVTPTFTLFSPIMVVNNLPFLNLKLDFPSGILLCALTIYPALDAIIVMYVVQDYRKAIENMFKKGVLKIRSTYNNSAMTHTNNVIVF